jgi:hypothetical protein
MSPCAACRGIRVHEKSTVRVLVVVTLLIFGISILIGCAGKGAPATLSGEVRFQGQPVEKGSIRLDPMAGEGEPAAVPITNGRYEFGPGSGLVSGRYRVSIMGHRVVGTRVDPETGQTIQETEQYIPDQYNTRTTLEITLSPGQNTQDFDLK